MRIQLLALIILALLPRLSLAAESPSDGIWVFEDTTASLSFEDVVAIPDAFVQTTDTNVGFSDSVFWIRVELTNDTDERQTQVVQFDSHLLQLIEAYNSSKNPSAAQYSGYSVAQHERPLPTMLPSFPVELESGRSSIQYFKIASSYEISLGYEIKVLNQALADNGRLENLRYALALGLFILLAYNVAIALIVRQAVHWFYVGFVGSMLCLQLLELNFFFLPNSYYLTSYAILVGISFGMIFLALLFGQMSSKRFKWSITGFCFVSAITVLVYSGSNTYQLVLNGLLPLGLAIISAQVIAAVIQQRPHSRLVLVGWACFVSGAVNSLMAVAGILPTEYISAYAVGSLLEATVFSIVLAYRLRDQDQTAELLEQQRQTNERQKEMFAVIGHELRTPVASMAMVAKDSDTSDASARQHMDSISSNLLSVLEDLRVVVAPERALESKLEVGHPAKKVERAISPLKPMIEEAGFSLSLDLPAKGEKHYHLHAQPLRQLVTNLVKNAVVHSGGDRIQVELTLDETDATQTQVTLRIGDNGKGLTKAEQQHVFEAFSRGDTSSDGSGLGLFIVSQLVKKMDGSLSYETSELGGACFVVSFHMQVAEKAQAQAQAQDILSGLNILLAEDDSFLAQLTQKMLSAKGANVTVAENGQIALDAFQTHVTTQAFDVVITDLMMPELDGHGLVKAIRESNTQLPIIAVTAAVIGQETDQLMAEGATAVLSKPIKVDELAEVLSSKQTEQVA